MHDHRMADLLRVFKATMAENQNALTISVLAAAFLENHLTDLIKERMPGLDQVTEKRLFDPYRGPIGTLANKIDMARALDVLSADLREDCVLIARIRNRFAHKLDIHDFDHPDVASLVDGFRTLDGAVLGDEHGNEIKWGMKWPRIQRFRVAALGICGVILAKHMPEFREAGQSPSPDKSESLPPSATEDCSPEGQ